MVDPNTSSLLTPEEAAARLRISERTLRKLRQQGALPYVSFGLRKTFYRPRDIESFIEQSVKCQPGARIQLPTTARNDRPVFDIEELRKERDERRNANGR